MLRRLPVIAVAASLLAIGLGGTVGMAATGPVSIMLPQGAAFNVLGYDCGGISEHVYATGFDPSSGFLLGDAYLSTTCSGSGRGGHPSTFTAWASATWDLTGALVASSSLVTAPTVDPTFSATDANGNEWYNSGNDAFLLLAPGFTPAPRIISVSASIGPSTGGTTVTISGTGLTGATAVDFGTVPAASYAVSSDDAITAVTPSTVPGTVDVTVTTAGGTNAPTPTFPFTFAGRPTITKISPTSGPVTGGTVVTITGTNLGLATSVFLGDAQVAFTSVSDTSIQLTTPAGENPDSESFAVVSPGGRSSGGSSTFTYLAPGPVATANPTVALPGHRVVVNGSNYAPGETVKVTYRTNLAAPHPTSVLLCSAKATTSGTFSCTGTVRKATAGPKGTHSIIATGAQSHGRATVHFTLL